MQFSLPIDEGVWTFGTRKMSIWSENFRLASDGRIFGHNHPNEYRWERRDNTILFLNASDVVTAELKRAPGDEKFEEWAGPHFNNEETIHYIRRKKISAGCFFRTHSWNDTVEGVYLKLRESWGGDVMITADMTRSFSIPEKYQYMAHSLDTLKQMGLPEAPSRGSTFWHNGDYILYDIVLRTDYDYIILNEYDTYVKTDLNKILVSLLNEKIDFCASFVGQGWDYWSWFAPQKEAIAKWNQFYGVETNENYRVMKSFFPFVFISRKAALALYAKRIELERIIGKDGYKIWPNCESFAPTELCHLKFKIADISQYLNGNHELSLNNAKKLSEAELSEAPMSHPVLSGDGFIRKIFRQAEEVSRNSPEGAIEWLEKRINDHFSPYEKEKFEESMQELRLRLKEA